MKEYHPIFRFALFSFVTVWGYHMLGFELLVVIMLTFIMFNVIESRGEIV